MGKFVVKDSFYNKAKKEGFRARSAYKLKEIQDKYRLIKKGDKVLDLGCAPGSFLQVLSGIVGDNGLAFGIDILPTQKLPAKNITTIQADIRTIDIKNILSELSITAFDIATCDIAPNLSGIRDVDNANIEDLSNAVIKTVREGLKQGGTFILKSFFTDTLKGVTQELQKTFQKVTPYKPAASRSVSSEIYLICTGKK
jgi:23S rRNA (uridine2552-2'-O)-methyltransferase